MIAINSQTKTQAAGRVGALPQHKPAPSKWFACYRPNPLARLRLFCLPYAGGGASIYREWANALPETVEVCPVQLPGREGRIREQMVTNPAELVENLSEAIAPYLDMPFAFFGHSMGARIGFELAQKLRKNSSPLPEHIFVSGTSGPNVVDTVVNDAPPIHQLPDADFIRELWSYNGTPAALLQNAELMEILLPIIRGDFALCDQWQPSSAEPLPIAISAFGGLADSKVQREEIGAWAAQTTKQFIQRTFPGDHFFIHSQFELVTRAVSRKLAEIVHRL